MSDFLAQVLAETHDRIALLKRTRSASDWRVACREARAERSLSKALKRPGEVTLIAELKQASPSAGTIRQENNVQARLAAYVAGGASAISILTEEKHFQGSPQFLSEARQAVGVPLLRKDFIVDPLQVFESRPLGADAVLLILAIVSDRQLEELMAACTEAHLEALVEVHDEQEVERALRARASLIGINNRNLRTLQVDPHTAERLVPRVPKQSAIVVVESGIREPGDVTRARNAGAQAVLVGEALMRAGDPQALVRSFVEAGRL